MKHFLEVKFVVLLRLLYITMNTDCTYIPLLIYLEIGKTKTNGVL